MTKLLLESKIQRIELENFETEENSEKLLILFGIPGIEISTQYFLLDKKDEQCKLLLAPLSAQKLLHETRKKITPNEVELEQWMAISARLNNHESATFLKRMLTPKTQAPCNNKEIR